MSKDPRVLSVATAVPPYRVDQEHAKAFAREMFSDGGRRNVERLMPVFDNSGIEGRHLCVPFEWARSDHTFAYKNALYVQNALELSEKAARRAMEKVGAEAEDVGAIFFLSTSGISAPTLDSKLMFRLGLGEDTVRMPIWGLGCAAGASGIARAADYARVYPNKLVLLIVIELCSYTYQRGDLSKSNLISSALFADGAAAAVLGCSVDSGPSLIGSYSTTWPDTEDIMGWEIIETGMKVRLSRSLPDFIRQRMRENLEKACRAVNLDGRDIEHLLVHPGGVKVLDAFEEVLEVEPGSLELSRGILRDYGNMSAATVLFVLQRFIEGGEYERGDLGLISAMGPGFSAEHVFLRC